MFDKPGQGPKNIKWTDLCYAGFVPPEERTEETKLNPPCKPQESFTSILMLFDKDIVLEDYTQEEMI